MKNKISFIIPTIFLLFSAFQISEAQISKELHGDWSFEAPQAPEGSTNGIATISADTVMMSFEGALQFPSDWVKTENDSIIYETTFDDAKVKFMLKIVDDQNIEGKAVWDEGVTPIIFKRRKI